MAKLLFIRHGITDENKKYHLIGSSDVPLCIAGMEQASCVAKALADIPVGLIVSSPLMRAKQTARTIAQKLNNVPIRMDERLQEIHLGIMDGKDSFEAYRQNPNLLDLALDETTSDFAFPCGESRSHALSRMKQAIDELVITFPEEIICIVTHGGPLGLWLADLNQQKLGAFRKFQPDHGSITEALWMADSYKIVRFNDCTHLC